MCAVLGVAGAWMLLESTSVLDRLIAVLCLAGTGVGAVFALVRLVHRGAAVEVDRDGIIDRSTLISLGRVRWDEISSVRPYKFSVTWLDQSAEVPLACVTRESR